jgi:hypothetical protein
MEKNPIQYRENEGKGKGNYDFFAIRIPYLLHILRNHFQEIFFSPDDIISHPGSK